ncbi:MAG: hypothetical protein Q9184_008280 [Pyrenodesmia sp. 2 TL-2023]
MDEFSNNKNDDEWRPSTPPKSLQPLARPTSPTAESDDFAPPSPIPPASPHPPSPFRYRPGSISWYKTPRTMPTTITSASSGPFTQYPRPPPPPPPQPPAPSTFTIIPPLHTILQRLLLPNPPANPLEPNATPAPADTSNDGPLNPKDLAAAVSEVRARIKEARRVAANLPMGEATVEELEDLIREGEEEVERVRRKREQGEGRKG